MAKKDLTLVTPQQAKEIQADINHLTKMLEMDKPLVAQGRDFKGGKTVHDFEKRFKAINKEIIIFTYDGSVGFKYFVKNHNPKEITTYADRSWSNGNLYYNLGFKYEGKTQPNYYYIIDSIQCCSL